MRLSTLLLRNLKHYWRTNLAVIAGVAIAVSVIAGAMLVGESVRASLRGIFLGRIGNTDDVITSAGFFREELAAAFPSACPMIALEGLVIQQGGGRRSAHVAVYGVDERFWKFHKREGKAPTGRQALLSEGLAAEIGVKAGEPVLVRVEKPSAIPAEWLHGKKDDTSRAMRFSVRQVLTPAEMGEFSLRPQQGAVRAIFLPLPRVQTELEQSGRVNVILTSGAPPEKKLRESFTLADLGLKTRVVGDPKVLAVESDGALLSDPLAAGAAATASAMGVRAEGVFTYLANTIRVGTKEVPYSLVTALDLATIAPGVTGDRAIVLNDWAASDLGAKAGDEVQLEYYVWKDEGRLATERASFTLAAVVPMKGSAADRDFAPEYPGMTDSESLHDWDPPFPVELSRVRPRDEEYWKKFRTTPKAFIPLAAGQKMWGARFGRVTSLRLATADRVEFEKRLRSSIDPIRAGFAVFPVRAQGLGAAHGATDFGEYFLYFSFFLMASALLLTGLFFRLGVEQRYREIGTLRAMGFPASSIRKLFLWEGAVLAVAGSAVGAVGAVAYGALVLLGLRTMWVGAVGTTAIGLHVAAGALIGGAMGGIFTAVATIAITLRSLGKSTPLALLAGQASGLSSGPKPGVWLPAALSVLALALLGASAAKSVNPAAGFFGAGTLLLAALLAWQWRWLRGQSHRVLRGLTPFGFRNASYRPGRSILCIALIAFATFLIVAIDGFRHEDARPSGDLKGGDGGFALLAETILPVYFDPNTQAGKEGLNIADVSGARFTSFRLKPGDDASCLNLYQPRNPRVLAPAPAFLKAGRFTFQDSLARTPEAEENPWLLLDEPQQDGAIPAIVDANTMEYALHVALGGLFVVNPDTDHAVKMRIVGALKDTIFQSELLISEANFLRAFPGEQGHRFFLIDAPAGQIAALTPQLEEAMSDYGFDASPAADRLAEFHRVENTYLSTFQALGSLGLLLGTAGLAVVMLRNVLERRKELALLQAVGYHARDLSVMILAENLFLLVSGLAIGVVCALLAIAPAVSSRGGHLPAASLALLLGAVLVTGLAASLVAMRAVTRAPLLPALHSE